MNSLAASHTGPRLRAQPLLPPSRLAHVEDLNWPIPGSPTQKKPPRAPAVRAPGPEGPWDGAPATRQ